MNRCIKNQIRNKFCHQKSLLRYLSACCGCEKEVFFERNCLMNELRMTIEGKFDAGVSKTYKENISSREA